MSGFPCTKCGACCKLAGLVDGFSEPVLYPNGPCVHLARNGQCVIYKLRPKECRIVSDFAENARNCNMLQEITNTPPKYRLPIVDNS